MVKRLLLLLFLLTSVAHAQTQVDRVNATTIVNRSLPTLSGTTPSVALGNVFQTGNNGTITNFTNGTLTQRIDIICADTGTAIANNANIVTATGSTLTCSLNTIYSFDFYVGGVWLQSGTSTGGGGGGGSTSPGLPNHAVQSGQSGVFTGDSHFLWTPNTGLTITGGAGYTHTFSTSTNNVNSLSLGPSAVSLQAGEGTSTLSFLSGGATQFTVGGANPFKLPTASGTAGQVLFTDGANPQNTSWGNNFTSGLQATLGTLTTDINPFNLSFTLNNSAQVFNGVVWSAFNTAYAAGSLDFQFCAGLTANACFTIDPLGKVQSANQVGSGDGSAAGNIQMLQGPQPNVLANNVGLGAPTVVDAGGSYAILPGSPCVGLLSSFILSAPIYQIRCSSSTNNRQSSTTQTASLSNVTLCSTADCPSGDYLIILHVSANQVCATPGTSNVSFTLTFTDVAGTKTAQPIPLTINGSSSANPSMPLGDTTHNASAFITINSNGTQPIVFNAPVVACTSGTAQYSYKIEAVRF